MVSIEHYREQFYKYYQRILRNYFAVFEQFSSCQIIAVNFNICRVQFKLKFMSFVTFEEKRTNSCNGNILSEISVNPFNNCGNIYFRKNLVPTRRKFPIIKIPLCVTGRIMLGTFHQLNRLQKPLLSPKQSCSTETKRNFRFLTI